MLEEDYKEKLARQACRKGELIWMVPLWRFALHSGLRISELAVMRHRDLTAGTLRITEQKES